MSVLPIDYPAARAAVDRVSRDVQSVLGSMLDTSVAVPRIAWTAGETGAHLVTAISWIDDYAADRKKPPVTTAEIPVFNDERIANYTERDGLRLADGIRSAVNDFLATTSTLGANDPFPWYDDLTIDVAEGTCIVLGELVVHGLDLARAAGRPWPIDADHARLILRGTLSLLPLYVDHDRSAGLTATYEIRVKGNPPVYFDIVDGQLTVTAEQPERVDCRVTAEPVNYLLNAFGRIGQLKPILTGKIRASGRKPWLSSKLATLFRDP